MKLYKVTLLADEREKLEAITHKGSHQSRKVINALILLNCDEGEFNGHRSRGEDVANILRISMRKVERVKKRFIEGGAGRGVRPAAGPAQLRAQGADGETRAPIPACPGQPERHDYEYERCGVCNIFMASEPLDGTRMTKVTERKAKVDRAQFPQDIAERYQDAQKITLVMDNLDTPFDRLRTGMVRARYTRRSPLTRRRRSGIVLNSSTRRSTAVGSMLPRSNSTC